MSLDSDEITTLVRRGKDLFTNGDMSSARLLLRRIASPDGVPERILITPKLILRET